MNILYDHGRDAFATKLIDWVNDTIKMIPVSSAYMPNLATDQYLNIISSGILATAQTLGTKSTSAGKCYANPVTFTGITAGNIIAQFVIYKDTGVSSTSPLIGYINVATGLPCTSNGGPVTCTFFGNEVFEL
jgi:hypothetical protein